MRFLHFLILSIRHRFPNFGRVLDPLLASAGTIDIHSPSHPYQFEAVIDALMTAIASEIPERLALILCNYHEVSMSPGVNDLINRFLKKLPSHCVIVIESRAVPDLEFASLLAQDEVVGFDSTFLCFAPAEIHALARLQGVAPLKQREVEQWMTLFDGWITGILLGTRLGDRRILRSHKSVATSSSLPELQIDRKNLFAYFAKEVCSHDPDMYTFLKEAAVLQQMASAQCDVLLERTDSAHRLSYLEQRGLFVTRTGEEAQATYFCYPILRDLLCDELRSQLPERFVLLHQRAMELWIEVQDYEQAIYHALEAKLYDTAAHLILDVQEQFFAQGRLELLSRWIDALPSKITLCFPKLLLVRAKIYLLSGEYMLALPLLKTAAEAAARTLSLVDADEASLIQMTISIARSEALVQIGEYEQAQKLCQEVIEQVSADETVLQAEAHTLLGVCISEVGDYTTGITHLQKALHLWGRDSEKRQVAKLHNILARLYSLGGNFALAEHHLSCAARIWDCLQDGWGKVNNMLNMGMVKQRQGEYTSAEVLFQEALTLARGPIHFQRGEAYALANLGDLYQQQGLYERSLTMTESALALARQLKDRYLSDCSLGTLAMTYLLVGDTGTAMFLISEVDLKTPSGKDGGYGRVSRELIRGTIFLYQRQYDEAYACLTELESYVRTIGLQWELLCTVLRLAECLLVQGHTPEALHRINEVTTLILSSDYEHIVLKELRLLPSLECAIRTMPELARLHTHLFPTTQKEKQEEPRLSSSQPISDLTVSSQARLKVLALGEPIICIDEKPVTHWRRPRSMELFFLLLENGHPLRKEQIITALWPEVDEHTDQTLHSTVHYLRKSLGESCIASGGGTYWLNLASLYGDEIWYDATMFQQHEARAKEALALKDDVVARTELLAMVELYRGDYLQSFYRDWCIFQRDKLRLAYLDARQQLALIAWRSEQFDESAIHWQHVLALDNCLESAHYGLMRCYLRQGKRGLALRQYQRCVEILQRELGVEPGIAIQNLFQHLAKPPESRKHNAKTSG